MLAERHGAIVNCGNVFAYARNAERFADHADAASKGTLHVCTRSSAAACADAGVRVNAVAPGLKATPMRLQAQADALILAYLRERQPLTGAPAAADAFAEVTLFVALDDTRLSSGEVLDVAGGWSVVR